MATVTSALTSGALTPVTSTPKVVDSALVGWAARVVAATVTADAVAVAFMALPPESGIVAMTSMLTEAALTRSSRRQSGA